MERDPVCGMTIAAHDASAVRHVNGAPVYFCSTACARQFDTHPDRYHVLPTPSDTEGIVRAKPSCHSEASASTAWNRRLFHPASFGVLAFVGLLMVYGGILTLAQGFQHAVQQFTDDRWLILAIALGFGTQIGLFTYVRQLHRHAMAGNVLMGMSTSTATMLACCAHHLTELLPIASVAGAAAFLTTYKTPMFWLSIVMNVIGIIYLLQKISQHQRMVCHTLPISRSSTP